MKGSPYVSYSIALRVDRKFTPGAVRAVERPCVVEPGPVSIGRLDDTPHIGYGINVWNNLDLAQPLGFDWIKVYEDNPSILATTPVTTHVLLRVTAMAIPASLPLCATRQ